MFQKSPLNNLCLWKFFPTSCVLSFSCSQFSVSSGSDQATCSSKLITKVEGESARRWCGKVEPPQKENQMGIREPFLVGYFALNAGIELEGDQFKCNIGCHRSNQAIPKPTTAQVEVEDLKCKCGVTSSSRVRRRSSLSRAFLPALLSPSYLNQSPYLRIVGGTAAVPGSAPWQASLAIAGEVFCGASVVTDRHLVTAAHCTVQIGQSVVGKVDILLNLYNKEDTRKQIKGKISKIINHPGFDDESLANDISVITLRSRLQLNKGRQAGHTCDLLDCWVRASIMFCSLMCNS